MGEVVPARTSPTLHPPSPPIVHQLLPLALSELMNPSSLLTGRHNFIEVPVPRTWELVTEYTRFQKGGGQRT